ncbi:MAG: transposase [Chloroflexota bacterium]|nr:transposase [Chloroflexota bacterium]
MTLPPCRSWFPAGERLKVAYEAPQDRRVNAIGVHFTHGPVAGRFEAQAWACLPKSRAKKQRKTLEELASAHGLRREEVGPIDSERVLEFIWRVAGRGIEAPAGWKRERPLMVVLDNYSVHTSQKMVEALVPLAAADVHLVYLPSYSPELSRIEPDWNDIKQHHLPVRSFEQVAELKRAVDEALAHKAHELRQAHAKTMNLRRTNT